MLTRYFSYFLASCFFSLGAFLISKDAFSSEDLFYKSVEDIDIISAQKTPQVQRGTVGSMPATVPYIPDLSNIELDAILKRFDSQKGRFQADIIFPEAYPYSAIGRLFSVKKNKQRTGFLVGPCHALSFFDTVDVVKDSEISDEDWSFQMPLHKTYFKQKPARILDAFFIEEESRDTNAVITLLILDQPLGLLGGWLPIAQAPKKCLEKRVAELAGYLSCDNFSALEHAKMVTSYGQLEYLDKGDISYSMDTEPGQGGSPILVSLEGEKGFYAVGLHVWANETYNNGFHIIDVFFDGICSFLQKTFLAFSANNFHPLSKKTFFLENSNYFVFSLKENKKPDNLKKSKLIKLRGYEDVVLKGNSSFHKSIYSNESVILSPFYPGKNKPITKEESWKSIQMFCEKPITEGMPEILLPTALDGHSRVGLLRMVFEACDNTGDVASFTFNSTGVLVGPCHVLTCAHNLYDPGLRGVYPMKSAVSGFFCLSDDNKASLYSVIAISLPDSWTNSLTDKKENDFGLAILDKNVGNTFGWMGLASLKNSSIFQQNSYLGRMGYHDSVTLGNFGLKTRRLPLSVKAKGISRLDYTIATYGGQSGSPLYLNNLENFFGEYVIGLHTRHRENSGTALRLTPDVFLWITGNISMNYTTDETDQVSPFDVRKSHSLPLTDANETKEPVWDRNRSPLTPHEESLYCKFLSSSVYRSFKGEGESLYTVGRFFAHLNLRDLTLSNKEEIAFYFYRLGSDVGHKDSQYEAGRHLRKLDQNNPDSFRLFYESSDIVASSTYQVAKSYFFGWGVQHDLKEAYRYFMAAHQKGYEKAAYYLGLFHYEGLPPLEEKNPEKAVMFFSKLSNTHCGAQFMLGLSYEDYNPDKALSYYTSYSSEHVDPESLYRKGLLLEKKGDTDSSRDYKALAKKEYLRAAYRGHSSALKKLKDLDEGDAVKNTDPESLENDIYNPFLKKTDLSQTSSRCSIF